MHTEPSTREPKGILRELIRSTLLKDILRTNLNAIHPESGSRTVKTLLGEDPEVFFGTASSLPVIINALMAALTELAVQLRDKYPPELLKSFLQSLYEDIDREAAAKCARAWADLASSLWQASPELKRFMMRVFLTEGPRIKAGAINAFSRFVNTITRDDPQALSTLVSEVLRNVDRQEAGRATLTLAGALLDQKWHLASWVISLIRARVRRRF